MLTLILAWISNYIHIVWNEIIYPFQNFNGTAFEVSEWISNFIPHFTGHVITCSKQRQITVSMAGVDPGPNSQDPCTDFNQPPIRCFIIRSMAPGLLYWCPIVKSSHCKSLKDWVLFLFHQNVPGLQISCSDLTRSIVGSRVIAETKAIRWNDQLAN